MRKTKLIKFFLILFFLSVIFYSWQNFTPPTRAQTPKDLSIDWGVPYDQPLFKIANLLPNDTIIRKIKIQNMAKVNRIITLKGIKTQETGNLSQKLNLTIYQNSQILFGPKNLNQFFNELNNPLGLPLAVLSAGETQEFQFKVNLDSSTGNEYQNKILIFDIQLGISLEIPKDCQNLQFEKIIFGSSKSEIIFGSPKNELIFGLEGSNIIFGNGGNDCLIGGNKSDIIFGGERNDLIFGQEGNDILIGNSGNDILIGGPQRDIVNGGPNFDKCQGELKLACEE